jgi:hypothetical protein
LRKIHGSLAEGAFAAEPGQPSPVFRTSTKGNPFHTFTSSHGPFGIFCIVPVRLSMVNSRF